MRHAALPLLLCLAACGPIDPEPPTDDEGVPIPTPGPFDDWLEVEEVTPDGGEVGLRPTIRVRFDTFIEDDELIDFSAVSLQSAGLRVTGRVTWEMTTRTLVFRPLRDLVPGLQYTLSLAPDYLESVTGAPFRSSDLPKFEAVEGGGSAADPEIDSSWDAVDTIFERKCRSCHADPQWQLNPLTRASMIGQPSAQTDQLVVLPFDPADSYLMHKILPDYPIRRFTVQPPPWSHAEPLTDVERRLVEAWIRNGAL